MNGSEKQVKWAEEIKAAVVADFDEFCHPRPADDPIAYALKDGKISEDTAAQLRIDVANLVGDTLSRLDSHQDAKWWINHRHLIGIRWWMQLVGTEPDWQRIANQW